MKRKLALICCTTLLAAMISACGGSTGSSSTETNAQSEPAAQETTTEAVEEDGQEPAETEAVDTTQPAEEEPAAEAATEAPAEAATEAAAEAATEAAAAQEGSVQMTQNADALAAIDFAALPELDESKLPEIKTIDEDNPDDKGIGYSNGELYEYWAFAVAETSEISEYYIVYSNPDNNDLIGLVDYVVFSKSAGYTSDMIKNIDLSEIYPNFYGMNCSSAQVFDSSSAVALLIGFWELDQAANLDEVVQNGLLTVTGYYYGCTVDSRSIANSYRSAGYTELSDYDLTQRGISP